jgi:hypothetical protein
MSDRTYRTAGGKALDMGALTAKNEDTRAVGNMNVNARGQKIERSFDTRQKEESKVLRLNKRTEKQQSTVRHTHGRFSPAMKTIEKNLTDAADAITSASAQGAISYPTQATGSIEDTSIIDIEEQIQAAADQLLQTLDFSESEIEETIAEAEPHEQLTGLAAAMAKAQKLKGGV